MSSGSDSDDEYVPGEPEQLSEEDSADEETEKQYENEQENKTADKNGKRKAISGKSKHKRQKTKEAQEIKEILEEKETPKNPEEEKKREDDLWAKFLEGTDTKPKPALSKPTGNKPLVIAKKEEKKCDTKMEDREKKIFEFAGETIVVENNVIKEKIKTSDSPTIATKLGGPSSKSRPGGLSSVLGQLNKKSSLSTLEKSKLDWDTYKKEEGIEEEVQSINKGKAGYLDRQDFLQRADLRQYELEREARIGRRSNR